MQSNNNTTAQCNHESSGANVTPCTLQCSIYMHGTASTGREVVVSFIDRCIEEVLALRISIKQ